ncbi:MAG TPA: hypothetical protein DCE14_06570 [Kosmotogaceae bacterium]|nr:hypothetical protein [Kosmotogaceae bacterium]
MKLGELAGMTRSFEISINDSSMRWAETPAGESLDLVSTSGLLRVIHECSFSVLEDYLSHEMLAVVVRTEITHVAPLKMGEGVTVEMEVQCPRDDVLVFMGKIACRGKQKAFFSTERRIVNVEQLGRKLSEEN